MTCIILKPHIVFLQKQQTADKRVMLAWHQLQNLQQQLAESQKLHKQLRQSLQLQQQQAEADKEGAKAVQAAAEASMVEADEHDKVAGDIIKQLHQQLQEQAAAHDAQVHAMKVMLTCLECLLLQTLHHYVVSNLRLKSRSITQLIVKNKRQLRKMDSRLSMHGVVDAHLVTGCASCPWYSLCLSFKYMSMQNASAHILYAQGPLCPPEGLLYN